jgi:hypothetical protein
VFTREAIQLIFGASKGIARTVSVLCDNALLTGFAAGERPVTARTVEEVCRDFDVRAPHLAPADLSSNGDTSPVDAAEDSAIPTAATNGESKGSFLLRFTRSSTFGKVKGGTR